MTRTPDEHRWVVDGIEEGMARVEEDGERMITVPLWLLPPKVREGQVLTVARTAGAGTSTVTITVDAGATSAALDRSRDQVGAIAKRLKRRDGGGNVTL